MAEPVGKSLRFDKELNQMLKRLLVRLQDYEATLGPLVDQARIIKGQVKSSLAPGQKITNLELKRLIGEKLAALGADPSVDTSTGNFRDLGRYISSLLATNPGAMGDIIEQSLSAAEGGNLKEAGKIGARYQKGLVELMPWMVGHHEQGLRGYRNVLEYLEKLPDKSLRERVLHILETKYQANFGEEGLRYLFPFAHKGSDIGPLGSKKHSPRGGVRKDIKALFDEAYPGLDGFHNLDQINPNLRKLIEPLLAHSKAARGTHGFIPPLEKIKGLTDANEIAKNLLYYVDANRASYTNAKALHDAIWKYGVEEITLPDGKTTTVLKKAAWSKGGVLEKAIQDIPITYVAQETTGGWGKKPGSKILQKANTVLTDFTQRQVDKFGIPAANLNLFSVDPGGAGTLYIDDFMTGVNQASADLVGNVDNAVGKLFNNLDNIDVKAKAWLLSQGPEKIAKGFLSDLGFGTLVGTVFDKEQQRRLMDQEYGAFANQAIKDELIGQGVWHGGKALWSALPSSLQVGLPLTAGAGAVAYSANELRKRSKTAMEQFTKPLQKQGLSKKEITDKAMSPMGLLQVATSTIVAQEDELTDEEKELRNRFIPNENESLFSTNTFTQPLGLAF